MQERERKVLRFDYNVPTGSTIMDVYGRIVGRVLRSWKIRKDPDAWEAEVDLDVGTDFERIQIMPPYGITGGVNA